MAAFHYFSRASVNFWAVSSRFVLAEQVMRAPDGNPGAA